MNTLATLHQLRLRLGLDPGPDDARLLTALESATSQLERHTARRFSPRHAALPHDVDRFNRTGLLLVDDLLRLDSLTNGDGHLIPPDTILALPGGDSPASVLLLIGGESFTWTTSPRQALTVTGIWGWHDTWSLAWRDTSDAVRDDPLSSTAATVTVASVTGADSANQSPRFQVGHLLRIEDEYLRVLAVESVEDGDDRLTVQRGVSGTTAASHAQDTPIFTYQPPADVAALVVRWAAWLYKEPDSRISAGLPPAFLREAEALRRSRLAI